MLIFQNEGLLDPRAFKTFGVSSKDSKSPIGYFGTGLKYAIAVLLREGQEISIISGNQRYSFSTRKETFRNDEFSFVYCNDEQLPFTTELGKNWQIWQAFRELYSNMKDEGGTAFVVDQFNPIDAGQLPASKTYVICEGEAIINAYERRGETFLEKRLAVISDDDAEAYRGESQHLFYKGVRVHNLNRTALNTYNLKRNVTLTEDRTMANSWVAHTEIAELIVSSQNPQLIEAAITADDTYFEFHLDYDNEMFNYSSAFHDVVEKLLKTRTKLMSMSARMAYFRKTGKNIHPQECELTELQQEKLKTAIEFCQCLGYDVTVYPIQISEFLGKNQLGEAKDGTIFVAKTAFSKGTKEIAMTILEEYIHLRFGLADETRSMQNFLFDIISQIGEQHLWKGRSL